MGHITIRLTGFWPRAQVTGALTGETIMMKRILFAGLCSALLLSPGCRMNANKEGVTPLMLAARSGDNATLSTLIAGGANLDKPSKYGWTALMFASWKGHTDIVQKLLQAGANPNVVSKDVPSAFETVGGHPPSAALREAIQNQHFDIAYLLLDAGATADPVACALAGGTGNIPLLEKLLTLGADLNRSSRNGFYPTPLCAASEAGKLEAVQWLIKKGADPNFIAVHHTALGKAVYADQVEIVEYLLKHGANPNLVYSFMKGAALHEAATKRSPWRKYDENLAIIRILLSHGADRAHKANGKHTALEFVKIQRNNGLKYVQKVTDPKIRKRLEDSQKHKDSIIDLLTKWNG
jgi:ankyrin repeat protein